MTYSLCLGIISFSFAAYLLSARRHGLASTHDGTTSTFADGQLDMRVFRRLEIWANCCFPPDFLICENAGEDAELYANRGWKASKKRHDPSKGHKIRIALSGFKPRRESA
jgi:hypothetical protein